MKKKALVTGACGFIGSHLVDALIERGYQVAATDLDSAPKDFLNPQAVFIPGDLGSARDMNDLFFSGEMEGTQIVFHVGAVFDFFPPYHAMFYNNVVGTLNVCAKFNNLLSRKNKRLVLFSSGVVHSELLRRSHYGKTKFLQEKMLRFPWNFDPIIVRLAAVIGSRSRYGAAKLIEMVAGGQMQFFVGKKNPIASLIHVKDVIEAAILLAEKPYEEILEVSPEVGVPAFDLVDDSSYSYEELLVFLAGLLKKTHKARILSVRVPIVLLKPIAKWQEFLARKFKSRPKIPVDMLDFFEAEMPMDNGPIKTLGFKFNFPDSMKAAEAAAGWYFQEGWI